MFNLDTHLRFFTDPLADTLESGNRIYCTLERLQRGSSLGKVVEVEGFTIYNGRGWRVSKDGLHLSGPVVNSASSAYNAQYIGLIDGLPGVAVRGSFNTTYESGTRAVLNGAHWSDQRKLPLGETNPQVMVNTWFRAASWARELWPNPTDTDEVVTAKLELAEQRWNHRLAKTTLVLEAANRGYDQLLELIEEGELPAPTFGANFVGDVLIPNGRAPEREQRTIGQQERIDRLAAKVPGSITMRQQYIAAYMEMPLGDLSIEGADKINSIPQHQVQTALRAKTGDYELVPGQYNLQPVLRFCAA
jgi:hypothetical protein